MTERANRKWFSQLPEFPDRSIPPFSCAQTATVRAFACTVRWSSVLATTLVAAAAWRGLTLPAKALIALMPALWWDQTRVMYLRIRRP
ncbi:hypothetical protein [Streptomyces pinistramenti]|uniref:hypothetical protein n=1 Tax=Streptomyces pinistramenti TaxID=2884812 RepID=UPI001D0966C5|nr:hypothetical protein [Streptomyces pinistramenti]MCB5906515.1 hypothetical protein [Streptomyces pinistramenti]